MCVKTMQEKIQAGNTKMRDALPQAKFGLSFEAS
jgi:hypothetical protein